jgi:hypothetical protein
MVSIIALITLLALIMRCRLHGESWLMAVLTGITRYLQGLISIAGVLLLVVVGIGTTRAMLSPVAEAALSLFPEGQPATSQARRVPESPPAKAPVLAALPHVTPTPRAVAAPALQGYAMLRTTSLPEQTNATPQPRLPLATLPTRTPTRAAATPTPIPTPTPVRDGCDAAYPDARTCIPPGPPWEQGCAITDERRFTVLPPDPQGLDHDNDGIGCEPVA